MMESDTLTGYRSAAQEQTLFKVSIFQKNKQFTILITKATLQPFRITVAQTADPLWSLSHEYGLESAAPSKS